MKRTRFAFRTVLALIFAMFVGPWTVQLFAQDGTWATKASMPTARDGLGTGVVNGVIYAVGGHNCCLGTVESYDPPSDIWTTRASMPTARYGLSTSVVNGILYAVGGYSNAGLFGTVEAYDPTSDTWTTKASMPTPRYTLSTSVVNGVIYAVGGAIQNNNNTEWVGTVEAYDPRSDTWTTKASMPTARYWLSTGVVNGIIYAVGGYNNVPLGTVEAYDPASDTWTTKPPMPTGRWGLSTSVVNGVIYAVGGHNFSTLGLGTVEAYDPASDIWTTKASMPTARLLLSTSMVNGVIYAVGGMGNAGYDVGTVEAFTPGNSNTPAGSNISAQPIDSTTNGSPALLTFSTVTQAGTTTLITSSSGPATPQGFQLGSPATYYNLATTAVYSGSINICINYSGVSWTDPSELSIWHYDINSATWTQLATTINTDTTTVCATTPSLSPFVILQPTFVAQVQQPINFDGSSVFRVKRGVVPVKFTLTRGGTATCQLPSASISLIRVAGAVLGPVGESVYLLASDSGSNFRVDGCQYAYNLGTSSLGTGTYSVNISIAGTMVGSGTFGLQ